ncbi:cell division protein FtsQ/DivIB [Alicyclobacillus shizuokensis]|uniref:cell division protein FtsQ/DivIB n=1 Tax=Alicyclobacillus shizuokensis TaxID=392014 RepID=UPI000834CC85|nr:FtsQ-type POTRA domain-containing protein [Alicyclobacillus shizuokensis]MCL6627279.1 FtsQ-type POTRA domain-containing protein [Alicyclobacillus shizuokensis]
MKSAISERPADVRQRRRVRNRILVACFFALVGVVVFLESPLMRVRRVEIMGNTDVPASRIRADAAVQPGMSLWQVNASAIAASLKRRESTVDSVQVTTDYMHGQVTLVLRQKRVVGIYQAGHRFYSLLADGTVFRRIADSDGFPHPILSTTKHARVELGQRIGNSFVVQACEQIAKLKDEQLATVSQIVIDQYGTASIYLDDGFQADVPTGELAKRMPDVVTAASYFRKHGYAPGIMDMAGLPPYRYIPYANSAKKGNR